MSVVMRKHANGKVLHVEVQGTLTAEDYKALMPTFEKCIADHEKIRVLFEMHDFHGWSAGALWEDAKLDVEHFNDIERLAFIGDKKWEEGMAAFCRPFTTAEIRYFDHDEAAEADEWILEGLPVGSHQES